MFNVRFTYRPSFVAKTMLLVMLLSVGVASYASLGLGKKKKASASSKLLSGKTLGFDGTLSLKSGYNFRGRTVLVNEQPKLIQLKTEVTMQAGKNSFTLPLKKNVLVNKVKIELGNRALGSH